ncbi:MAG TPA: PAS domain S-box protein [Candidatus Limnocylindrales bacterium]
MTADPSAGLPVSQPATPDRDALLTDQLGDDLVRQSIDAVIVTDEDFVVRIWNAAAERLYGIAAIAAVGRPMSALVDTFDASGSTLDLMAARTALSASGVWRQRVIQRPRSGPLADDEVIVDSVVTPLRPRDGRLGGVLAVNRDVTASARLEAEIAALGSLVAATGGARTRAEVAQAALDILCRATGADAGLVTSTDGVYDAIGQIGVRQETIDVILAYGRLGGPLAQALAAPGAFVSADVATAPLREDVRAAVLADGIEHLIVVGLRLFDRLTGILALGWRRSAPHEPSRAIMSQAAALIAASLENARLFAAVESGLSEERLLTRRMGTLVELTRLPETTTSDATGAHRLMREIGLVLGADAAAYARIEDDRLVLEAVDQVDFDATSRLMNRTIASTPTAAALAAGAPAVLVSIGPDTVSPEFAAAAARLGFRSTAAFAIRDDDRLVGVMMSVFRRPIEELDLDERTLESIGRVLDISFANGRLREVVAGSERRYRELFEASPDALVIQSSEGLVVDANTAAIRLFGGDLVGRRATELVANPPPSAPGETGSSSATLGRRLDGSTFPQEVELRPIEIGGQRQVLAIVHDLTERQRIQAELVQAQKMEAIGMLVAGVAHELNNPLASIVGFSHLLRTDPNLPADLRGQADLLVQESNRTRGIVQNLLDFARQRPPERVEVQLRPLLDSVLGLQAYVLSHNRVTVDVDLAPNLPRLLVDRSQIQQVLINLTLNAAQAISAEHRPGTIRIHARPVDGPGGGAVRIEIADTGPGIPSEIVNSLFVPFLTTKPPGAGAGLGLSVSFGIVASHGGTLRHERNADGGATFIIELPIGGAAAAESAAASRRGAEAAASDTAAPRAAAVAPDLGRPSDAVTAAAATRPQRVLVLDDEPSIRDLLGRLLSRTGRQPILVATGAEALDIVAGDPPDAILCDYRMAGMTGTEFHAAVMSVAPHLAGHFAFMSGDVLNPELREFAEARAIHLLAKPFDLATVGSIVTGLVGRPD